jgi:hypothetical protein
VGDENENARMRARYDFSDRTLTAALASEGMNLAATRKAIAVAQVPLLSDATSGVWSGEVGYGPRGWSGDLNIRDADIAFEAFSAPIHVISADATLAGKSMTIRKLNANVGNIEAQGEYRYDDGADNPHRFRLTVAQADAQDLEKLLQPALRRGSLLNYAFNFGRVPQPDWLRNMRAAGTIQFNSLDLGGAVWTRVRANVDWNATQVTLTGLEGQAAAAALKGEAHIDLSQRDPSYELTGTLAGFVWHGGVLSAEGRVTAAGNGKDVLTNMRGEGTFRGRSIDLTPLDRYRAIQGTFAWTGRGPRLSINELKLESDAGTLTGEAEMQDNGVVVLKATDGSRQVTASGALMRGEQLKITP